MRPCSAIFWELKMPIVLPREVLKAPGGQLMQLSRPLDFVAITDHAEGFGTRTHCGDEGLSLIERKHAGWSIRLIHEFSRPCLTLCAGRPSRVTHPSRLAFIKIEAVKV